MNDLEKKIYNFLFSMYKGMSEYLKEEYPLQKINKNIKIEDTKKYINRKRKS